MLILVIIIPGGRIVQSKPRFDYEIKRLYATGIGT
jgi:hypothetical protein